MPTYAAGLKDVRDAAERIAPHAHVTPVMTSNTLDRLSGRSLYFKCENFQKVGAFKTRGACNAILSLSPGDAARGVVTHSSGNHAQAVARAAAIRGIEAHIVMPRTAPSVKRAAVEGYGAKVYPCEPNLSARQALADQAVKETGATFISPFDDPFIIAGQGTVALELMDQVDERLDAIIAPIGGGGLMSGLCVAAKGIDASIRMFAAEPAGADDAARSMLAGRMIPQTGPDTIADGLLTSMGENTWPIVRDHVEQVITVTEDQIVSAMRLVWERMKIIIEPSAAVAVAAVLCDQFQALDGLAHVGVVLTGGNVDLNKLPW